MLVPITLIIAHHHQVFRTILQNIFQSQPGIRIIAQCATAVHLVETSIALQPQVIIADVALPGMEGLATLQKLEEGCKESKVILSWRYCDKHIINEAIAAQCAGYIVQDTPPAEYFFALKQAMKGNVFYCSQTERLRNALKKAGEAIASEEEILSEKYLMMAYCLWIGFSTKETAIATSLTESTINTYRKKLKKVLGSGSVAALESFMKKNKIM